MYAIIESGGKQFRISEGDSIKVEKLDGAVGDSVEFGDVHFLGGDESCQVGDPIGAGKVTGTILEHGKGDKVIVFKFKRRKMYRRRAGHRQHFTKVKIDKIEAAS